ncbi:protein PFC0760c-like [Cydia pomonella]|uniref:protein PFC0760c-like n=1 Tax=Cydia pomonella TaxID=82600 RepID=UPI002ADE5C00|nr:protein PFC0760c-like [Cydia pomonella]XP_061716245.1 protein PFC0760c-like [Cydia pomonella]
MTSAEEFNCILCKETFDNKDELQIHFRKHGDPKFNESIKTKSRVQNEAPFANEKSNDASEMVNCDVCDEVFPTISKAITHKHKLHPEHDAKYFCPWCGKLFTMKHLYNKHLHTNHDATEEVPGSKDSHFHCDSCSVYFVVASAMVYHNKFFHRQDSDLPIIGHSKKQKMVNQDLLPVYYCSFCGEEYINKVNLHKHMCDDHEDENQRPTDVLRCPLCEAVFYHLDAYELHLTFHSSEDLYSETNEMNENEITEFSLETVPPVMERIEDLNSLPDVETDINAVGIESFLQMAMDEPKDSNQVPEKRSKKHKKHKKSKKAAITLDEFLSMNQDVFGEDLDFQGIEEVPTKVITKQLKVKKPQIPKTGRKHVSSADLQKLQKLGIAVKVPSSNKPPFSKVKSIGQAIKINPQVKNIVNQPKSNAISASNDVLSKLLNQSSSQLKIVKKSAQEKAPDSDTDHTIKTINQHPADTTEAPENVETNSPEKEEKGDDTKSYNTQICIPKTNPTINPEINDKDTIDDRHDETVDKDCANAKFNESNNDCTRQVKKTNASNNVLADNNMNDAIKHIGKQVTIKPITQSAPCDEVKRTNTFTSEVDKTDEQNCPSTLPQKTNTLDTLKSLNSAITIKSLKNISVTETTKISTIGNEKTDAMYKKEAPNAEDNHIKKSENINKEPSVRKTSPALQSISKNITIKSKSPLINHPKDDVRSDEYDDYDFDNPEDDTLIEHQSNSEGDKVKEQSVPITAPHVLKNVSKNKLIKPMSPLLKHSLEDVPSYEHNDSDFDNPEDDTSIENQRNNKNDKATEHSIPNISSSHVLKNISKNITIKPRSPILKQPKEDVPSDEQYDSDFDNLEDDTSMENKGVKSKEQSGHMTSTSQVLKNISKNITIKSMSPLIKHSKDTANDEHKGSNVDNPDDDGSIKNKNKSEKNTEKSALANLKNINKNLTIKPMSPMMKQTKEDVPQDENNDSEFDNFEDGTPKQNQNNHGSALDRLKNKSNIKIKSVQTPLINKKTFGNINENITDDETHKKTNIQSSNNILKNLKNITAKPVLTNKSISQQGTVKSSITSGAIKQGNVKQSFHSKELNQDIEIYNIDDSDDEYEQQKTTKIESTQLKKEPIKANVNSPAVLNAIKNMSKHITFKPSNNQVMLKEVVKKEETFSEQFSDEYEMPDDGEFSSHDDFEQMLDSSHKPTFIKKDTINKSDNFNNVLKQLGQHVTVKSKNAFNQPNIKTVQPLQDINQGNVAHATDSDEEPYTGKVKITEVTEDDDNIDHENDSNNEGIVSQSPEDSNTGDEQFTKGIDDMDEYSSQNIKVRLNDNLKPNSQGLLKNISKNITIKSISEKSANSSENGSIANQSLCKPVTQNRTDITNDSEKASTSNMHNNKRKAGPGTSSPSCPTVQQKFTKSGAVNTVNKEVKVKTFQSETVIEEITTTVTKTIRRVNQTTVNQQVFNASKVSCAPRMVKPQPGPRMPNIYSSNNLKGLTVRQPNPSTVRPKIRQTVPVRPPSSTVVRPAVSNQLVPMRPSVTPIRPMNAPRMPVKNMPRQSRPVGRPLKISPNVVNQTLKRPGNEDPPGHFSCFKKPKESLIPGNETADTSSNFHYASSSQTSKFCSTSQTVKGNSVVTSTQMKAQSVTQQQQINRLGNISGLKVAKTCQVSRVEKTEISPSKRTALEAIEKLQKQGLLIKKPRVEEDPDPPNCDGEEHEQYDDYDYDE